MRTEHRIYFTNSQNLSCIGDKTVNLIVTSPPYPMIEMWDTIFLEQNHKIGEALEDNKTEVAFELMHQELDKVWTECYRMLKDGGFLCVNIGDATRTINGDFKLYNSHSRIIQACLALGFTNLPNIIWHKATNAPNKFMGSGMLPCGAYVTLEHEHILIFRKTGKRVYKQQDEKDERRKSAFFWEERNIWFSDIWNLVGTKQKLSNTDSRERSAAYPLEIPFRLINMYSQAGDLVLDPFFGLGTTTLAAMLSGRNSIGCEIDEKLLPNIEQNLGSMSISEINRTIATRYQQHVQFVKEYVKRKGEMKHFNSYFGCPVVTSQEEAMELHFLTAIEKTPGAGISYTCSYEEQSDMDKPPKADGLLF